MTKSGVIAATLMAMGAISPVFAADLMPYKAPAEVPWGWTQWYIGGEVGGKWGTADWGTNCIQGGGTALCGNALNNALFPGAPDSSATLHSSGLRAGAYLGKTYQIDPHWVVGVEADYAWSNQSASVAGIVGCSTFGCRQLLPANVLDKTLDSTSVTFKDDASLRLRAGYLLTPDLLLYGTGGVAAQQVDANMSCGPSTRTPTLRASPACLTSAIHGLSQTDEEWFMGFTVGAGLEWKFAHNWLLRGEYRYSNFGTWKPNFFEGSGIVEVFPNIKLSTQTATAGIAYAFPIPK